MNIRTARIFVIIEDGKAILADTNLKDLWRDLNAIAPDLLYDMLYKQFRQADVFERTSKNGRTFTFQVFNNPNYKAD